MSFNVQFREVIDRVAGGVPGQEVSALPHQRAHRLLCEAVPRLKPFLVVAACRSESAPVDCRAGA
jgi:hypothetical protein